jgi:aminopeptidase N
VVRVIWSEHTGNKSAAQYFKHLYNTPAQDDRFWNPPPGDPGGPSLLFNGTIYDRGGMTLEALREKIGNDATFFKIMRDEAQENRFGTVTTPGFIAIAERDSGLDLGKFFQAWLDTPGKPTDW